MRGMADGSAKLSPANHSIPGILVWIQPKQVVTKTSNIYNL
jgi:hypothetical protein